MIHDTKKKSSWRYMHFRFLRAIRTANILPRKLLLRLTDRLLPIDPNDVKDPNLLNYPVFTVTYCNKHWELDLNSHIDFHAFFDGVYDYPTVQFMRRTLKRLDSPVCMDIGANIGNHILPIADIASRILAFEPNPKIADKLTALVKKNGLKNVEIYRIGLGDQDLELPFYDNPTNPGTASFVHNYHPHNTAVALGHLPVRNGDSVLNELNLENLDFIKIDVEGFEYEVLLGIKDNLEKHRPLIMFEFRSEATRGKFGSIRKLYEIFPDQYHICGLGSSVKSRFLGDGSYDQAAFFFLGRNYGNVLAFPNEKYDTVFPRR